VVAALGLQRDLEFTRHGIDEPETGVVAGVFVFRAGIAQADEQFDHALDYRTSRKKARMKRA
jgi:hypothetical protein